MHSIDCSELLSQCTGSSYICISESQRIEGNKISDLCGDLGEKSFIY